MLNTNNIVRYYYLKIIQRKSWKVFEIFVKSSYHEHESENLYVKSTKKIILHIK